MRDKLSELGNRRIFPSNLTDKYFEMYNSELDGLFNKTYIDTLFKNQDYFVELIP